MRRWLNTKSRQTNSEPGADGKGFREGLHGEGATTTKTKTEAEATRTWHKKDLPN